MAVFRTWQFPGRLPARKSLPDKGFISSVGWYESCFDPGMLHLWRDRAARHGAVTAKPCLRAGLWWAFVRDVRVEPDAGWAAEAMLDTVAVLQRHALEDAP
jgi:hypothetical protein